MLQTDNSVAMGRPEANRKVAVAFSARLQEALDRKGWGQSDLARELEVSRQQVHQWLAGDRTPSLGAACEIADVLGVSLDYLAGRKKR
jgi:repressor LexA